MVEAQKRERLRLLLIELMQGQAIRAYAKKIGVNYGTLGTYLNGDSYPRDNAILEKLAQAKGWTIAELNAYLNDAPMPSKKPLEDVLQDIRALPREEAVQAAYVAIERIYAASSNDSEPKFPHPGTGLAQKLV